MTSYSFTLLILATTLIVVFHAATSTETDEDPLADDINDEPTLPIDEIIVNSANTSSEFDFFYDSNARFLKVEYDMVYSYEEWAANQEANGYSSDLTIRKKRTAGIKPGSFGGQRWTNNIVPFQFAPHFSGRDIRTIHSAIADWERYTCLDFQQTNSRNRILFKNGGGCYSRVGMVGGAQDVGLAPGCRVKGVVIHEIGHALGLHHEQTRPDRDQHVRIIRSNIPGGMYYNFKKNTWNTIMNMGIPYDYTSIMHYGKTAFSVNGRLTIQTVNPQYQDVIGNRHGLSFGDIKSINIMYNCKRHQRGCTKTDASCAGQGFVGKDCTCVCPGGSLRRPTVACSGGGGITPRPTTRPRPTPRPTQPPTPRPTTRPAGCQDQHSSCSAWASRGECRANPAYMHVYCKRSCNRCGGGGSRACADQHYACAQWRRYGYCNYRYQTIVRAKCKRSCGLCGSRYRYRGYSAPTCRDSNTLCSSWARRGECQNNPGYMLFSCKLSCHQCVPADEAPSTPNCQDLDEHCSYWSGIGECTNNPGYMRVTCKESCGFCTTQ